MRHVDGDVVFCREVGQDLHHFVDGAIFIFSDRMRLDEGVEGDEVDFALDDDGLDFVGQLTDNRWPRSFTLISLPAVVLPGAARNSQPFTSEGLMP